MKKVYGLKKETFDKVVTLFYWLVILILTFLFFTNDFGLVDIRKSAIIVGLGLDVEEDQVKVTAQLAVPQPSESGENTQFTQVEGEGITVGEALKDVNAKTGFLPKLVYCKLIILGESCQSENIFALLDYFYRNEYSQLVPIVAACKGEASELLGAKLPFGDSASASIERLLSDEAKKSANVATINLKGISLLQNSPSNSCYMPYIESTCGSSEESGGSGGSGSSGGSESGQQSSGGGSGGSGGGSGGDSGGGQDGEEQFTCTKTAIFKNGSFCGLVEEGTALALNLLRNPVRHTFIPCKADEKNYTIGMRSCSGGVKLRFDGDTPVLKIRFKATAQIQDVDAPTAPKQDAEESKVPQSVLDGARETLIGYFNDLIAVLRETDCDALGVKELLHRYNYSHFKQSVNTVLQDMRIEYDVNLKSAS